MKQIDDLPQNTVKITVTHNVTSNPPKSLPTVVLEIFGPARNQKDAFCMGMSLLNYGTERLNTQQGKKNKEL